VVAVHSAFVETDMTIGVTAPKIAPGVYVAAALDALEAGRLDALADEQPAAGPISRRPPRDDRL
jgi:hypothetical protein